MVSQDVNKIIFNDEWEFVVETDIPPKAVMKLNQWRVNYEIVFISVRWVADELNYIIARRKRTN